MAIIEVSIKKIVIDFDVLLRNLDEDTKDKYVLGWMRHDDFPAVVIYKDGNYLADGLHRTISAKESGHDSILADVKDGGKREAIIYACGANDNHGLHRTNAIKRKSIRRMLLDPEWREWSNATIGKVCRVSTNLSRTVYREMVKAGEIPERGIVKTQRRGRTVTRKATRSLAKNNEENKKTRKSGTSKKHKRKTQDQIHKERTRQAIDEWRAIPHDGTEAAHRWEADWADDMDYIATWCREYAREIRRRNK